jgi:hypothetical protein
MTLIEVARLHVSFWLSLVTLVARQVLPPEESPNDALPALQLVINGFQSVDLSGESATRRTARGAVAHLGNSKCCFFGGGGGS